MAIAHTAGAARRAPSLAERFAGWRARLADALAKREQYDRTLFELRSLSDRELDDLGVARADIRRLARESVYGA